MTLYFRLVLKPMAEGTPRTVIIYSCSFEKVQAHRWELTIFSKLMNYIINESPVSIVN